MLCIENLILAKSAPCSHVSLEDVWSAVIQKNTSKNERVQQSVSDTRSALDHTESGEEKAQVNEHSRKVKFLEKGVKVDFNNFPKITMNYEEHGKVNEISITRDQIVKTLSEASFDAFLIGDRTLQEFIIPAEVNNFISNEYGRSFSINDKGNYEIDLGYHFVERETLKKYSIEKKDSYRPGGSVPERTQIYVYDKENYLKALLALNEIKGSACPEERRHQLTYYIRNNRWEKLERELKFLINLKAETGVEIDYTELLSRLWQHTKDHLQAEAQENTIQIIEKVCADLATSERHLKNDLQKEIHFTLFELTIIRRSQLGDSDKIEALRLSKELFIYAQKLKLPESNHFLAEMAGLKLGCTFSSDVNESPDEVLLELAEKNKATMEENALLKEKIAKLEAASALQGNNIDSQKNNTASYFGFKK